MRSFLDSLEEKTDKNSKIQYKQVNNYIILLKERGARLLPATIAKHIKGTEIWELRPGDNRIFFFCYHKGTYVLLHYYVIMPKNRRRLPVAKLSGQRLKWQTISDKRVNKQ